LLTFATVFIATGSFSILYGLGHSTYAFAQTQPTYFDAKLTGKDEVPPKDTKATGTAGFNLVDNGNTLSYSVNVTDTQKVTAAHIHQGKAGANGPVVVTLFKTDTPSATTSGTLSKGNITSTSLEGPLAGKKLTDLISIIKDGNAYVNVHTEANPKGEIRGQLSPM
jgi:hypothetical protein